MTRVAVFRPADERIEAAAELLESLGVDPVADPMLAVRPTGSVPEPADVVILTSTTGVDLVADAGWDPGDAMVCAVGAKTAAALRERGYEVALVPDEFDSAGLVAALRDRVDGKRVEIARSAHGSETLPDGLREAGAAVHETTLYELERPATSGRSADLAAAGELDGALFTSSRTVEHFLAAAEERGEREAAVAGLNRAVVGAISESPAETAEERGIAVDVVPESAGFEALARAVVDRLAERPGL